MFVDHRAPLSEAAIAVHDAQKDYTEGFWGRWLDRLRTILDPDAVIADAGVGSGVVAARLADAGWRVVGFDLNTSMLQRLRRRVAAVPIAVADVRSLPIGDGLVDAVLVTNVLHLVADWEAVIAEAARSLRRRGRLLVGLGGGGRSEVAGEINQYFRSLVGTSASSPPLGPQSLGAFNAALVESGLLVEPPIVETVTRTVSATIDRLQHNVFTWAAGTPQAVLDGAAERTRSWAAERFGGLDRRYEVDVELALRVASRP